jgi:hypothetical protein
MLKIFQKNSPSQPSGFDDMDTTENIHSSPRTSTSSNSTHVHPCAFAPPRCLQKAKQATPPRQNLPLGPNHLPLLKVDQIQDGDMLLMTIKNIDGKGDFPSDMVDRFIQRGQIFSKYKDDTIYSQGSTKTIHSAICIKAVNAGSPNLQVAEASGMRGVRIGDALHGFYKVVRPVNPQIQLKAAEVSEKWAESKNLKYSKYKAIASIIKIIHRGIHTQNGKSSITVERLLSSAETGRAPFQRTPFRRRAMCTEFSAACLATAEAIENQGRLLTPEFLQPDRLPPVAFESVLEKSIHYITLGYVRIEK